MIRVKNIPLIGTLISQAYHKYRRSKLERFSNSGNYWEQRYKQGGNSGPGSYHNLAKFKAKHINEFVKNNNIKTVLELGSGDGNQLKYFHFESYTGYDVSQTAIAICKEKYQNDSSKQFKLLTSYTHQPADLALSLDVIYHLVEDEIYTDYMNKLFSSLHKFVIIYSSNTDKNNSTVPHIKHRKFTDWVKKNAPQFKLIEFIPNQYPLNENITQSSFADFYFFQKQNQ